MEKYCYVTLLYLDKNNYPSYLDGVLLSGLGLRRQGVQYKLICLVTSDVTEEIKKKDEIIEKLSKGGGGGLDDDLSNKILEKLHTLEEENKNPTIIFHLL